MVRIIIVKVAAAKTTVFTIVMCSTHHEFRRETLLGLPEGTNEDTKLHQTCGVAPLCVRNRLRAFSIHRLPAAETVAKTWKEPFVQHKGH